MGTNPEHEADRELILRCQAGDRQAFERLVKRHYQGAFRMALYWSRNREAALDISQEAFVRIYRNIQRFEVERCFAAWLYAITKNLCRNYRERQQKRWRVFSDLPAAPGDSSNSHSCLEEMEAALPEASSESMVEGEERYRLLWKAIRELPEDDREVIILKDLEEFSYREISEVLEIPIGSVMSRLYHARKKLARRVERLLGET